MHYDFYPERVCCTKIEIDLDGDVIENVRFQAGCNGNLKAVSALIKGKKVEEVTPLLEGIKCGFKQTSCADQLVIGLKKALEESK